MNAWRITCCFSCVLAPITDSSCTSKASDHIASRIYQEARILLKHTDWNISEISQCLGFEDVSHFFKTRSRSSPLSFRATA